MSARSAWMVRACESQPSRTGHQHRRQFALDTVTMKTTFLAQALALVTPSQAYLRFGCATLTVQRLDPLVEPGAIPSAHLHQIIGGNGFNATMDPKTDVAERATCTTCTFSEDFSNYWTAVMYLVFIRSLNTSLYVLTFPQYVKPSS